MKLYKVNYKEITVEHVGRRIDNYLFSILGNIPKSRVYSMIRTGEVRINKGRIKQSYRLRSGDLLRIPPFYKECNGDDAPSKKLIHTVTSSIIYEDQYLLVLNKPAGIAVHSGSKTNHGVIEILRSQREATTFLELAHRLDKATSGCLLLAKDHRILRELQDMFRCGMINKQYLALLKGHLGKKVQEINLALRRHRHPSGNRLVEVDPQGKQAKTRFYLLRHYDYESLQTSLVKVSLLTGRTHQIRAHAAHLGHSLAGDKKYGDWKFNQDMRRIGLKRLFLHAETLSFTLTTTGKKIKIHAPLPLELADVVEKLA